MSELTHAGGIAVKNDNGVLRYLIVTAKKNRHHWVLPKGHIELGETMEQTAEREVMEEGGIEARLLDPVGTVEFRENDKSVRVKFYLMEYVRTKGEGEGRLRRWCTYEEALGLLSFDNARVLLRLAKPLAEKRLA
jgi:8-oxo-dGTP pyrophosphatase MutT (NUDIX family)